MAYSFTTQGAIPKTPTISPSVGGSSTPAAKALSGAQGLPGLSGAPVSSGFNVQTHQQNPIDYSKLSVAPASPGILKSQTVNHPDGTSIVHQYDTATPQKTATSTSTSGLVNKNQDFQTNTGNALQGTPQANPTPTFSGMLGTVAQQGSQPSAIQQYSQDIAKKSAETYNMLNEQLAQSRNNQAGAEVQNRLNPIPIGDQTGREAVIRNQYLAEQNSLASRAQGATNLYGPSVSAAATAQGQQYGAANNAASLASPVQVPYSNQVISPVTGQSIGGGGTGQLPQQAQDFVNSLAQQVKDGRMTREDAESRLSAYGQPGLQGLNAALGSSFNTNASNASAATTATGQQIAAAIVPARQALDALQGAFDALPGIQKTSIPILNQFSQNAAMTAGPGRAQASAFQAALQEARSRIDAALVGSIGVNAAAAQASALLPDNMVPSEIPNKIAAAKMYLENQLASYTQSGQQGNPNVAGGMNSGGIYAW